MRGIDQPDRKALYFYPHLIARILGTWWLCLDTEFNAEVELHVYFVILRPEMGYAGLPVEFLLV